MNVPVQRSYHRRALLRRTACGFGYLAFAGLAGQAAQRSPTPSSNPLVPQPPMFGARAKRVIFLFMHGGPSHVDLFDYKPDGQRHSGQTASFQRNHRGESQEHTVLGSPWKFRRHGESGRWVSELFPHTARHVDDMCFLHGIHTEGINHGACTLFLHTGAANLVRPSMGSWVTYGLGTENEDLPGFVTICPSGNIGGARIYSSAFLPSSYQGTALGRAEQPASQATFKNLANATVSSSTSQRQYELLRRLNAAQIAGDAETDSLDAAVNSFEMAYRIQRNAPHVSDVEMESPATLRMYGIGQEETDDFGRQCLLARRLSEAGVRFVQLNHTDNSTTPKWDQHFNLKEDHPVNARQVDQPIAALLQDLKQRGLLADTLVWWGGEFGRTPFSQNTTGRDHNPHGFTMWLAGGGVKPGIAYGATDEFGFRAVQNRVHMHDLHATILHLLGLDHEQLTYRFDGRDFRLTDVAGDVVTDILA